MRPSRGLAGWSAMGASAGARVALGSVYAFYVTVGLAPPDVAFIFQVLLLQGGLIALLSASSYVRASAFVASGGDVGALARDFTRSVATLSLVALLIAAVAVLARSSWGSAELIMLSVFIAGAVSAATTGLLQGIVVQVRGGVAAFAPTVAWSLVGLALVGATWGTASPVLAACVWVAPQMAIGLHLAVSTRRSQHLLPTPSTSRRGAVNRFGVVGTVNAGGVGAQFLFREAWAGGQGGAVAAESFFVLRLTELVYQLCYMVAGSVPGMLRRFFWQPLTRTSVQVVLVLLPLAVAGALLTLVIADPSWSLTLFLVAESIIVPVRLLALMASVSMLGQANTAAYIWSSATGTAAVLLLLVVPPVAASPFALQLMQVVAGSCLIGGAVLSARAANE